jgi:hypothetical protein
MHRYHDVSDLNAPWDALPMRGLGAGVLATGSLGSLGALTPNYPWMQYSADTKTLQELTNEALKAQGYCPIKVDGKLGPATCGALKAVTIVGVPVGYPSTCKTFTPPTPGCTGTSTTPAPQPGAGPSAFPPGGGAQPPGGGAQNESPPPLVPGDLEPAQASQSTQPSTTLAESDDKTLWIIGGGIVVAAIAAVLLLKK